ncbi:MAG: porin family protein [Psychroflexus sp.]
MRTLVLIMILLGSIQAEAQLFSKERVLNKENFDKKRWSWGYYLGMNFYDFQIRYKDQADDIAVDKAPGFNVGLIGNLRINDYIDLRLEPGVTFANRNLNFPNFEEQNDAFREVKSSYIHIPLLVKFSTKRMNNFKPFLVAGASISHNLSSNQENPDDNSAGQFRMKKQNYYYEVGFGIDFYLEYFKFTPSIRGVFGMSDELVRDENPNSPWTSNIESLKTRGIFLNFTFQ